MVSSASLEQESLADQLDSSSLELFIKYIIGACSYYCVSITMMMILIVW